MNTLEITVQRKQGEGWPVIATQTRSRDFLPLRSDGFLKLDLEQLEKLALMPKEYGKLLGQSLFQNELRDAFTRTLTEARSSDDPLLRVLLFIEAEELRDLRWERLCAPLEGGWRSLSGNQQTPFSLYLPSLTDRRFPPFGRRDLRALVLVAGPEDLGGDYSLDHFDIPGTVASVRQALGEIPCDVLASVEGAVGAPTLDNLCERITSEHYTLLHMVCHGQFRGKDGETILYFPDNTRRPVKATTLIERLGQLSGGRGLPHLVFLSTCESANPKAENGLGGFGQRLVRELGMPAVVAMTDVVTVATAGALAAAFYTRLREHGEADRALAEACAGSLGRADVTVPALFSRLGGRPLFSDTLDRPLTAKEIAFGLDKLSTLLNERAPVLLPEFQNQAGKVRATLEADAASLSPEAREERLEAIAAVNQICSEACDLSFTALALGQEPPPYDTRPPFRGLFPFRREDQEFFFGRELLVEKLLRKVKEHNFLAVLGPSGSGKSSLVLAGLIPALDAPMVYLTPNSDPGAQLETALRNSRRNAVVVVDQLEELFTLCSNNQLRQLFIERLLKLSESQRVIVTMRADFWGEVAPYPALREAMQNHLELVAPMDTNELRRAMDMQAAHVGLRFEADLSQDILDDVQDEPGAMPLLQHALLLLWNRRHGRWLRSEEYRQMGGIRQAIARTADEVYESLPDSERERMRDIFVRLTRLDEQGAATGEQRDTRRRVGMDELVPAGSDPAVTANLVKRLADARLVVTSVNAATRQEEVEVAHEALIRYWPRLRGWLDEDRVSLRLRDGIREAALEWEAGKRDDSLLVHRAGRLEDAVELSNKPRFALNALEQEYLNACVAVRERERLAAERRRRRIVYASLVAALMMMLLGFYGLTQADHASKALVTANYAEGLAQQQAATAIANGNLAKVRELAALAVGKMNDANDPDLAFLLAAEAQQRMDSYETRNALLSVLQSFGDTPLDGFLLRPHNTLVGAIPTPGGSSISREQVCRIAINPSGTILAAGLYDGTVVLWDLTRREPIDILSTGPANLTCGLAFSSDGSRLVFSNFSTETQAAKISVWEVGTRRKITEFGTGIGFSVNGPASSIVSLVFAPNSDLVAVTDSSSIIEWDISTGEEIRRVTLSGYENYGMTTISQLAFSPDGKMLAAVSQDFCYGDPSCGTGLDGVSVWETDTLELLAVLPTVKYADSVAFSPDGKTLATGAGGNSDLSGSAEITLWEVGTWNEIGTPILGNEGGIDGLAFSLNGTLLASAGRKTTCLWDLASGDQIDQPLFCVDAFSSLAFSPDGKTLATAGFDKMVHLWDLSGRFTFGQLLAKPDQDTPVYSVAYSPDGKTIAWGSKDNNVILSDVATRTQVGLLVNPYPVIMSLAFSPDGNTLAVSNFNYGTDPGAIVLWDAHYQVRLGTIPIDSPNYVTFSPDGKLIAATDSLHYTLSLWDSKSLALVETFDNVNSAAAAFSPDGKLLAFQKDEIIFWDLESGTQMGQSIVTDNVLALAFSPDGTVLASGDSEHYNVSLWDVATQTLIGLPLSGHTDTIDSLSYSPDGKILASGSWDGSIHLWDTSTRTQLGQPLTLVDSFVSSLAYSPDGTLLASGDDYSGGVRLWPAGPQIWSTIACHLASRNFTQAEWAYYFPGENYRISCPDWPAGN